MSAYRHMLRDRSSEQLRVWPECLRFGLASAPSRPASAGTLVFSRGALGRKVLRVQPVPSLPRVTQRLRGPYIDKCSAVSRQIRRLQTVIVTRVAPARHAAQPPRHTSDLAQRPCDCDVVFRNLVLASDNGVGSTVRGGGETFFSHRTIQGWGST